MKEDIDSALAQQRSIERLCTSICLIETLVPLELNRFSQQRKRQLESAYKTLKRHALRLDVVLLALPQVYHPQHYLVYAHLVADHLATHFALAWQRCEKLTPTRARQLIQTDYDERKGIVETREGPALFAPGDYLALDDLGEYPIRQVTLEQHYVQIELPDAEGWASYRSTEQREARQQFRAFATDRGVTGLAGDYLLRGPDGRTWPCAQAKFAREYRLVGDGN